MESCDAIIIGGGIIGLSLAIELRKQRLSVLVIEKGEPGREASAAAAGMLVGTGDEMPTTLRRMAAESAQIYPEFVHELEDESGIKIDLRDHGTIVISLNAHFPAKAQPISIPQIRSLEPELNVENYRKESSPIFSLQSPAQSAAFLAERSVSPRPLMNALIKATKHRGVDIVSGTEVIALLITNGQVRGVQTRKTSYASATVINCAGAWAGNIGLPPVPIRPVKGQMLAVTGGPRLTHVIRADDIYIVPRSDGQIVIGSTLEEAGFNKQTDVSTIEKLLHTAVRLVPGISKARLHEAWAGLRPGTPDKLPILGATPTHGYYLATGHYRDGILLAPSTARAVSAVAMGKESKQLLPFSVGRFF